MFCLILVFFNFNLLAIDGCFCNKKSSCYSDGCTRKTIKDNGSIDYSLCGSAGCGGAYNACYDTNSISANRYFCIEQPPCCEDMVRRNDPEACCWPERGYCHPDYCKKITRKEKCGWYWQWHDVPDLMSRPYGYGCVRGKSAETMEPVFGLPKIIQDTVVPTVTIKPTLEPTRVITNQPINYISPTTKPLIFPSFTPTPFINKITEVPIYVLSPTIKDVPIFFPNFIKPSIDEVSQQRFFTQETDFKIDTKDIFLKSFIQLQSNLRIFIYNKKQEIQLIIAPLKKLFYQLKKIDKNLEDYLNEKIKRGVDYLLN